ncbi:MAG TPA: PD-(D/E)XK nuclease family protein [Verrucomicrobiae bacterium]|nr:PD-(D/E)XK nuclease family protein [Verrucomicrobiae bacterium]
MRRRNGELFSRNKFFASPRSSVKHQKVQIRFLLGPAGSGKTFRCLAEIRDAIQASSDGLPLILLAPKQATFQLERQLAEGGLSAWTRLRIYSFERLAEFVFDYLGIPLPKLLSEEGRVMVLRALLERHRGELRLFRASARLPGFARQLSQLLRELQRYHLSPLRLETLAGKFSENRNLSAKLADLSLLARAYADWLKKRDIEDADRLLDLATEHLEHAGENAFSIAGLWLDGFVQMTPQERRFLSAICRRAEKTTLAFCLDGEPEKSAPWHSSWAPVTETFLHCREELGAIPDVAIQIEILKRGVRPGRFDSQPALKHLEKFWAKPPVAFSETDSPGNAVRIVACASPEAEVEFAAREIHRYVRERNGRFRDAAILVRSLENYHDAIRRVFARYEIPVFLDRRESVSHHPLAELTRYALRLAAFGWEHEDWFGALKTGLVCDDESAICHLENEALARGWRGKSIWTAPLKFSGNANGESQLERARQKIIPPFEIFHHALSSRDRGITGAQLAGAIRELWKNLKAGQKLDRWSADAAELHLPHLALHETVWEQMGEWLENLELAFPEEALSLQDWLPILEAGLGNLSVGVIPPALDQVLVGAIDRSRNPDLKIAFVLGLNEGVFPAPPPAPILLNRTDRETLASRGAAIGPDYLQQIGMERYYGYIACTRARQSLVLTCARRDGAGREQSPSAFLGDVRRLFPKLEMTEFSEIENWKNAEHWSELSVALFGNPAELADSLSASVPLLGPVIAKWKNVVACNSAENLSAELVEKIYGAELRTSVSALESFAECPFKFFVARGLRAGERVEFELDARDKGNFQHEVLKEFHLAIKNSGRRWRDLTPGEARLLAREIGERLLPGFRDGLFTVAESRRFTAEILIETLEQIVETLVGWAKQYQFDPAAVEISFGLEERGLPAWRIELDNRHALLLRGRMDRVDICSVEETGEALAVVIDYKSSARRLDPLRLHHGLELQLLAYLGALSEFKNLNGELDFRRIIPAGAFYVALRANGGSSRTREEELGSRDSIYKNGCKHSGRFDGAHLQKFDSSGAEKGDQFKFNLKKGGDFSKVGNDALTGAEFQALIEMIKDFLKSHGREIFAGRIAISPFRAGTKTACDRCEYRPVCRFDPWTQSYRVLRPPVRG